jgi:NAD(P)-dependent dehydrogenase (short-subunit alcohol dehydrogenase family)
MSSRPVVLVTGAARRIGRAIALELARGGFDIALHHRSADDDVRQVQAELREAGASSRAFVADLADEAQAEALVPALVQAFGRLDAVVNNASLFTEDTLDALSYASIDRHWRVNTAAPIVLARALHRLHHQASADAPSACVVNLLDQKLWNPNPDYFAYTLAKAALREATVMLALALAPRVRVCGVAPGVTLPSNELPDQAFERAHRSTPLGRSSQPQDVARTVRFVIESPAITGHTIVVDGGQHLWPRPRDVAYAAYEVGA